jgi:hypothetical protein
MRTRSAASVRARRQRSRSICMRSQNSGPLPRSLPSRSAISGVTACSPTKCLRSPLQVRWGRGAGATRPARLAPRRARPVSPAARGGCAWRGPRDQARRGGVDPVEARHDDHRVVLERREIGDHALDLAGEKLEIDLRHVTPNPGKNGVRGKMVSGKMVSGKMVSGTNTRWPQGKKRRVDHAARRGGMRARSAASVRSRRQRSRSSYMRSQNSGPLPQNLPSRSAISGLTACSPRKSRCGVVRLSGRVDLLVLRRALLRRPDLGSVRR